MNKEEQIINYLRAADDRRHREGLTSFPAVDADTGKTDDCSIIDWPGDYDLILGSDFVRGTGFQLFMKGKLTYKDLGYFLCAANASDLAAMGATPVGFLDVFRYKQDMHFDDIRAVLDGILEACDEFSMPLVGGDTGSYEVPVLSGTALGICKKGAALLRSNGKPGDNVFLSAPTGIAGAANIYFGHDCDGQLSQKDEDELLRSWKRPQPQLDLGMFLTETGFSNCAIDTSDGLRASIEQLSEASNLRIVVRLSDVPVSGLVRKVAAARGFFNDGLLYHFVFSDSVDFRLVFSVPRVSSEEFEATARARGYQIHCIGYFAEESTTNDPVALTDDGEEIPLPGIGWDQGDSPGYRRLEDQLTRERRK